MEERLDKLLVARNLVSSRVRAEQIIQEFGVKVNGKLIHKTGKKFPIESEIELISEEIPWISKDSLKLEEAYKKWNFEVKDKIFLDVGCSSGGFSEFLLENGAKKVYAIDSSATTLHLSIKEKENLIDLTGKHLREITPNDLEELVDSVVVNAPFLAMEKVFPFVNRLMNENGVIIAILKPDFEADKKLLKHDGSAKNDLIYPHVLENVTKVAELNQLVLVESIFSPILGNNGHKELIAFFQKKN